MKKHKIISFLYIFFIFILSTCNDPVFYAISQEVKPIEPRIKGVPSNFAFFDGCIYVAAGNNLFSYNKSTDDKPYWKKETGPGEKILQIASAGGCLYALCSTDKNNDGKTALYLYDKNNLSWSQISGLGDFDKLHNIFAAGGALFISVTAKNTTTNNIYYTIFYIDINAPETVNELLFSTADTDTRRKDSGELSGAAYNTDKDIYFLAAKNKGVYRIDNFNNDAILLNYKNKDDKVLNINFTGIINLENSDNTILLIARNGDIYTVDDSIEKNENISMGKLSTGALFIYKKPPEPGYEPSENPEKLLIAGRQDSLTFSSAYGYSYGYMELELDAAGIKTGSNFVEPGKNEFSTLTDYERYQSTIGKQPVNYLFQVPYEIDKKMILFASTQKNGVWSYRERDGIFQWNAEGENEPIY